MAEAGSEHHTRRTALDENRASDITLFDVVKGAAFPSAPVGSVLLSSRSLGWQGIIVEWQRLEPQELPEHYVLGHGLTVHTGNRPIPFGWRSGRLRDRMMNPDECHLLTHGDFNAPRWLELFDEISIVLDRQFVADIVRDGLSPDRIEFVTQRAIHDPTIAHYAKTFRAEIAQDGPRGSLYADTLAIGFALHLLARYAVAKAKIPLPRGKLSSYQLRTVVDFIESHLSADVSLIALADQARVSPFHFARQFKATVGVAPHQFVLQQRVQKSIRLVKAGGRPLAEIAILSGFHDQAHLTRTFCKFVGTTPAAYSRRG